MTAYLVNKYLTVEWNNAKAECLVSRFEVRTRLSPDYELFDREIYRAPEFFMNFNVPLKSELAFDLAEYLNTGLWADQTYVILKFEEGDVNAVPLDIDRVPDPLTKQLQLRLRTQPFLKSGLDSFSVPVNEDWLVIDSGIDSFAIVPRLTMKEENNGD